MLHEIVDHGAACAFVAGAPLFGREGLFPKGEVVKVEVTPSEKSGCDGDGYRDQYGCEAEEVFRLKGHGGLVSDLTGGVEWIVRVFLFHDGGEGGGVDVVAGGEVVGPAGGGGDPFAVGAEAVVVAAVAADGGRGGG